MADKDDDAISLTSTIEDEDKDYYVAQIIGEKVSPLDGKRRWLVEWEGYPLHAATWEPREHLDGALGALSEWEELKLRIRNGAEKDMLPQWVDALKAHLRAKWKRHCRRNKTRRLRGLETTNWPVSLEERLDELEIWLTSNEDTAQSSSDDETDFAILDNPTPNMLNNRKSEAVADIPTGPKQPENPQGMKTCANKGAISENLSNNSVDSSLNGRHSTTQPLGQKPSLPYNPQKARKVPSKTGNVATKSKTILGSTNVFAGGKQSKKRTAPETAGGHSMVSKAPSLRVQNLSKKKSRDRENAAPPTIPKSLRSLNRDDPTPMNQNTNANRVGVSAYEFGIAQAEPRHSDLPHPVSECVSPSLPLDGSRRSSLKTTQITESPVNEVAEPEKTIKRKKSVRFNKSSPGVMECNEPSLFVQDDTFDPPNTHSPKARSNSMTGDPGPIPQRHMSKTCMFGAEASRSIILLLLSVPQPEETWAEDFKSQKTLMFNHTCHASDFVGQFLRTCDKKGSGSVSAAADSDTLDAVTDRLKLRSLGVFCYTENFCIILYPSKSEEWADTDSIPTTDKNGPLQYIIFGPAPFSQRELPSDKPTSQLESFVGKNLGSFLNLEAGDKLIPTTKSNGTEHHLVFLAYPPEAIEQSRLMTLWIKVAYNGECIILDSNYSAGDWNRFVDNGRGALIIHEDALKKIRLFPRMFEVLKHSRQGHIVMSVFDRALANSVSSTMWAMKSPSLGNIGLRKLPSSGVVFMLTPSFIVSSPKGCRRFLHWFWEHHTSERTKPRAKLAVPSDILDWMEELVMCKIEACECAEGDKERWESSIDYLRSILQDCSMDDELDDTGISAPFVTAPGKIDPSDEQSLVNWFGWWTLLNLDKYCGFYVLGGGPFPEATEPTIRLQPVQWEKDIITDSDLAFHLEYADPHQKPALQDTANHQKSLQIVRTDAPSSLRSYLKVKFEEIKRSHNPMFLNFVPVAYEDNSHAYHCGDIRNDFSTYQNWFRSSLDVTNLVIKFGSPGMKHTLAGFFYTPEAENEAQGNHIVPPRRPWIAMFRPCNPDQKRWTQTELFIWDQRYRGKIKGGQDLYESDLLPVHRGFIAHVGRFNNEKNPKYTLGKVWVGGWDDWTSPYDHPLDITLDRLNLFADSLRRWVPYSESDIPHRGWTMVEADTNRPIPMAVDNPMSTTLAQPNASARKAKDEDEDEEVGEEEEEGQWDPAARTIFHPPRGHNTRLSSSLCTNRLHSATKNPVVSDRDGRFDFKYVPTKLWYGQQLRQGRGFEHIMVDSWQKVFDELKISWA